MEAIYIYGIKSAGILAVFYLCYLLFLQKETFFNTNRWFLLSGICVSIILPIIIFTKIVWITPDVTDFTEQINTVQKIENIQNKFENIVVAPILEKPSFEINWTLVFMILYGTGIMILTLQFISELYSIKTVLKRQKQESNQNLKLITTNQNIAPFSFFKFIVFNPNSFSKSELHNIIAHEKVHCDQFHSVDVILARLFSIVFWFNPLVWLYKRAIVQNLEFIADLGALNSVSDRKSYQLTLLKVTTHQNCVALSNPFYQSLIKKRIVMLNKNQSKKWNSWKFAIVFPILAAFVFQFQMKVVAQEKEIEYNNTEISTVIVSKTTTDGQLKADCERVKKAHNIDLKFYKIKRNKAGEIQSISASFNDNKGSKSTKTIQSSDVIDDFIFVYEKQKNGKFQIGFQDLKDAKLSPLMKEVLEIGNSSITRDSLRFNKPIYINSGMNPLETPLDALYLINDSICSKKDFRNIISQDIQALYVLKPIEAITKYGEKGKNGAIEMITKNKNIKVLLSKIPTPPTPPIPPVPPIPPMPPTRKVIVIDAGHGGNDDGASSNGFNEKQIVENIANTIKSLGNNTEIEIILTRSNDKFVSLEDRTNQINELKPDLLISLHVNASKDLTKKGVEIYIYDKNSFYKESFRKAAILTSYFTQIFSSPFNFKIDNANFIMLKKTNCPAMIIELGYITNKSDRNFLTNPKSQNEIANTIFTFLKKE